MRKSRFRLHVIRLCILLACTSWNEASAQGFYSNKTWKFSNPRQFGFTVLDVDFFDDQQVAAVGNSGGIAISQDAGRNWTYGCFSFRNSAGYVVKSDFQDVHFISSTTAYAVGNGGCMAKTTDAGQNWQLIRTPLFDNRLNINTVWFLDEQRGFIGGQFNSIDSIPRVYFTNNGGNTWDSLAVPASGVSLYGYINNPSYAPIQFNNTGKGKEIWKIEFSSPDVGYIIGGGSNIYLEHPSVDQTTCLPDGFSNYSGAFEASLVWKFDHGVMKDYSLTKERLGYNGHPSTVDCSSTFRTITPQYQLYRALSILNDSTVVLMSFNNNIVVKVHTGSNDSTLNVNIPGLYENGRYELLNYPDPPNGAPSIPPVQVLNASNPYTIRKAANGKLFATSGTNFFSPVNTMWTSLDSGRNWLEESNLPSGQNFSAFEVWALDISPSGKFIGLGSKGVTTDSTSGGTWQSTYKTVPLEATHEEAEFADCNFGIMVGSASITVTEDGGQTWIDKRRQDFANSFYFIGGVAVPNFNKSYYAVSNGIVYVSGDRGTTLDPSLSNFTYQFTDVEAIGNDTAWAVGYTSFSLPPDSMRSKIFRTFDGGLTWTEHGNFPSGSFEVPFLYKVKFANRQVGYTCGSRNAVYKTTDGGTTWTSINPFPLLNEAPNGNLFSYAQYEDMEVLNDSTVIVVGNLYTDLSFRRIYKTTNGGQTWTDISGNIASQFEFGNLSAIAMHDANNGYVSYGTSLFKTTDGGTTWNLDDAPDRGIFETLEFFPKNAPAGMTMANRRLIASGASGSFFASGAAIFEYGDSTLTNISTIPAITNTLCDQPNAGSISLTTQGGFAPYQYSLNGGAFQSGNVFSGLTEGTYQIDIKDGFCLNKRVPVTVTLTNNLQLDASPADTLLCKGSSVVLQANSNLAGTYSWSPADGLSDSGIANPVASADSNITYIVTASLNNCTTRDTIQLQVTEGSPANAGPDRTVSQGNSVILDGSVTGPYASVLWTPATGLDQPLSLTPQASPDTNTVYTLTVTSPEGCISTDQVLVTVLPDCIDIKNAFSPNGDGIHDRWVVSNGFNCARQVQVKVVNRYGSLVYSNDFYENNWDGTYHGKPVPDGTYYYVIQYKLATGKVITRKGDVTILR